MNTELLFQLYTIYSPSKGEKKMRRFIRKYITEHCGDVKMVTDSYGNLLCTKGDSKTYPCLASHMDQVQKSHSKDFRVITDGEVCFGYSPKSREQQGLGADDKNGIFICLECLKTFDVLKVAFFVGEEIGCVGSSAVDLDFFSDCRFIVEPDRRGNSDLITSMFCGQVCSDDFIKAIDANMFGYKEECGSITDVGTLTENGVGISCLNLSCGYYEAHTDTEFTVLPELSNCLSFVKHIIINCLNVYPYEYTYDGYGGYYGRYGVYGSYGSGYTKYGGNTLTYKSNYSSYGTNKADGHQKLFDKNEFEHGEDYYLSSDEYDTDYETMRSLILAYPNLSFEEIYSTYGFDFYASIEFDYGDAFDTLNDIYDDIKNESCDSVAYSHEEIWGDDDDDDSFPEMKRVS